MSLSVLGKMVAEYCDVFDYISPFLIFSKKIFNNF